MNRPDGWLDQYIGLPWKAGGRELRGGIDCWGLARLVLREEAGIELPSWEEERGARSGSCRERSRVLTKYKNARFFIPLPPGEERVFDLAGFFLGADLWHVGILVKPPHTILHIEDASGSQCEDWNLRPDLRRQFGGYWRALR